MDRIMKALDGCNAVLALRIGHHPMKALENANISVFQTCGRINEEIDRAYIKISKENLKEEYQYA